MHNLWSYDDDDDEELFRTVSSESSDTDGADFDISTRPALSPTPGQGPGVLTSPAPIDIPPASSAPPVIHSLLSDDDEDDQDSNTDEAAHTTFPIFSRDNVRNKFALGVQESQRDNVDNGRAKSRDGNNDHGGGRENGDGDSGLEGEMVGPGYATPPRYGGSNSHSVKAGLSDQELKRAWSKVEQVEQEIDEEEAEAILASERRKRRRQELMDTKRSFLDLE
jgi:hypothetical protein